MAACFVDRNEGFVCFADLGGAADGSVPNSTSLTTTYMAYVERLSQVGPGGSDTGYIYMEQNVFLIPQVLHDFHPLFFLLVQINLIKPMPNHRRLSIKNGLILYEVV